jgi:ribosomal protein S12 methylthiotransferase
MSENIQTATKGLHMISLGCPKNLVDSEIMLGQLLRDGYKVTDSPQEAETIVINTCSFIDEAKQESVQKILEMAELKGQSQLKNLVVTGCLVQRYKQELIDELPEVDVFVGSGEFQNIHKIIGSNKKDNFYLPTYLQEDDTPRVNTEPFYRAYLKISEGCLKRCSFCAIPKIRGNLKSRRLSSIINEVKLLVAGGVREINVISHDFTDYGWDLRRQDKSSVESPYELLKALSEIEDLKWVRVLYLYPDGITQDMIDLIAEKENLVPYFDMPLQHINDHMLQLMNRQMTGQEIKQVLKQIRERIPEAVIRTQFIVGFPGETEEHFAELLDFIQEQRFDRVGCFQYSPQEGTSGFKIEETVSADVKQERYDTLMKLQMGISREMHRRFIGETKEVVIDGLSEETDLLLQGRLATQAPGIDGVVLINEGTASVGDFVKVKMNDSHDYDLIGSIEP